MLRHTFAAVATLLAVSSMLVGCGEEPGTIEIEFTNATDRRLIMLVVRQGDSAAEILERLPVLPYTSEAGSSWHHGAPTPPGGEPGDGQWCEPLVTYVFMSPKDPTVTRAA